MPGPTPTLDQLALSLSQQPLQDSERDPTERLLDDLVELVGRRYPGWERFDDPRFLKEEVDYKRKAASEAAEILSREALEGRLARREYDGILEDLRTLATRTNLLYLATPSTGDLALLHSPDVESREIAEHVFDLLHGDEDSPQRLRRFHDWASERSLPNKWTFPTYYLFLRDPTREIFVKPGAIGAVANWFGLEGTFRGAPDADSYSRLRQVAQELRAAWADRGATDLIDIQSLFWVVADHLQRQVLIPSKRGEFEELLDEMVSSYLSTERGQEHLRAYPQNRKQGRQNYQGVLEAEKRGDDITDLVLHGLLPHADNPTTRAQDAWVHVAAAITGNLRKWFEANRWVDPRDWSHVAEAILRFVRKTIDRPGELEEACAELLADPKVKGMQAGFLSPILNALAPDRYMILNVKSRETLSYFTGKKVSQALIDYPAANRLSLQLVEDVRPLLEGVPAAELPPGDVFDMFSHWLVAEKKYSLEKNRYWKIAPGEEARFWEEWRDGGYVAIGWGELGDISKLTKASFDQLVGQRPELGTKRALDQVWKFAHAMQEDDYILANRGTTEVLALGRVAGPYFFTDGAEYPHRRAVTWFDVEPRTVNEGGWRQTLVEIDRLKFEGIQDSGVMPPPPPPGRELQPVLPLATIADESGMEPELLGRWVRAIHRKGQAILYGPPGTGKTYLSERLARHLVGGGRGFWELVQFHPAYAYEDFIQGIRPETRNGLVTYELMSGRFVDFCRRAQAAEGCCVLVVDEINRANLSRVFGELMYLLEYRDRSVPLASGGSLEIPGNVFMIGTMNTADRSIALVDHALRRRFAFLHLEPDYRILERYHERHRTGFDPRGLIEQLRQVNRQINDTHCAVGVTFFLLPDLERQLADVWSMEIVPYLEEYFFDQPEKVKSFHWDVVKSKVLSG